MVDVPAARAETAIRRAREHAVCDRPLCDVRGVVRPDMRAGSMMRIAGFVAAAQNGHLSPDVVMVLTAAQGRPALWAGCQRIGSVRAGEAARVEIPAGAPDSVPRPGPRRVLWADLGPGDYLDIIAGASGHDAVWQASAQSPARHRRAGLLPACRPEYLAALDLAERLLVHGR